MLREQQTSWLICGEPLDVRSVNFLMFRMEHQANLLWINSDSSYNIHEQWLQEHFKKNERAQILIVQNENVLTPASIIKVKQATSESIKSKINLF